MPSIGIPGVFMKMNSQLQNAIQGLNLKDINPRLPSGIIEVKEGYLKSQLIPPSNNCYISGRFDILSRLDDGSYSVIDFKITDPKQEKVQKFAQQLRAYKFALENPQAGSARLVSKMGVVVVSPESISFGDGGVIFKAQPEWFEITENRPDFLAFVDQVSKLLSGPVPAESESCEWCQYREIYRNFGGSQPKVDEMPF